MLVAVLVVAPRAHVQETGQPLSAEEREALRLHPAVQAVDDAIQTVDGWLGRERGQDDAIPGFDEDAARAAEAEYQSRQRAERMARLQAQTPQERSRLSALCASRGEAIDDCEREHLLPEEIRERRADRNRHTVTAKDRLRTSAADIGARDTVLVAALDRECTDNARPSDYCRELVQKAEALGRDARALLDDPDDRSYLQSVGRAHMPQSFFRARQVTLQPGAESHFREGMSDTGERVPMPTVPTTPVSGEEDPWADIPDRKTPASSTRMLSDSADPAQRALRQQQMAERRTRYERQRQQARGGGGGAFLGALLQTGAIVALAKADPDAALSLANSLQTATDEEATRQLAMGALSALAAGDAHQAGQTSAAMPSGGHRECIPGPGYCATICSCRMSTGPNPSRSYVQVCAASEQAYRNLGTCSGKVFDEETSRILGHR